ncbi:hypothetical protein PLESTM_001568000 [Pleodorina starrii]|nr:hypothetical protein PLESTM_001568000 [Pleodorina starrii]
MFPELSLRPAAHRQSIAWRTSARGRGSMSLLRGRAVMASGQPQLLARHLKQLSALLLAAYFFTLMSWSVDAKGANIALGKPTFNSSCLDVNRFGSARAVDGNDSSSIFVSGFDDPRPWLSIDLGELMTISKVVYKNNKKCCGDSVAWAEIRVGGAALDAATHGQVLMNELVHQMTGPSRTGEEVTVLLDPPVLGRYVTMQNFHRDPSVNLLQVAELEVEGAPAACSLLQESARYGEDALMLSNSTEPNAGACCQACYDSPACLYWDWERGSGICRLKGDQGGRIPPGQTIPGFFRDIGRVAGAKRGVSFYTYHHTVSLPADSGSYWLWSTADTQSAAQPTNTVFVYRTISLPTAVTGAIFHYIADDFAVPYLNGRAFGPRSTRYQLVNVSIDLPAGDSLIAIAVENYGGQAGVEASLLAPNGTVLVHTDGAWAFVEVPPPPPPPPSGSDNIAFNKPVFALSTDSPMSSYAPSFAVDGSIPVTGDQFYRSAPVDTAPWLAIDLGDIFHIDRIVYYNRRDCCGNNTGGAEFRVGGAQVPINGTAQQMTHNTLVHRSRGSGSTGQVLTINLDPPVVGRWLTMQSFGSAGKPNLQIAELQAYGAPAVCSIRQYGASYGNDAGALSTLRLRSEGACCDACARTSACLYWDYDFTSGSCRLKGLDSVMVKGQPALVADSSRVCGVKRPVGFYTRHPSVQFSPDSRAHFIWSRVDVSTNEPPADQLVYLFRTLKSETATNATFKVLADDTATVFVNGKQYGPTVLWDPRNISRVTDVRVELQPGDNLIVLMCTQVRRGPAMVAAALFSEDGSTVLLRTDYAWGWIEAPATIGGLLGLG